MPKFSDFEGKADRFRRSGAGFLVTLQRPADCRYGVGLSTPVLTVCVLVFALGIDVPVVTIRLVLEVRNCKSSKNSLGLRINLTSLLAGSRSAMAISFTKVT